MVWTQLQIVGSKAVYICSIYRPLNNTDPEYLKALEDCVSKLDHKDCHIWIGGDLNLGDIDWNTTSPTPTCHNPRISNQLLDLAHDLGLSQIVDKPTCITETTESILDLFLTNVPEMVNDANLSKDNPTTTYFSLTSAQKLSSTKKAQRKNLPIQQSRPNRSHK